jgi:hypothetical protein
VDAIVDPEQLCKPSCGSLCSGSRHTGKEKRFLFQRLLRIIGRAIPPQDWLGRFLLREGMEQEKAAAAALGLTCTVALGLATIDPGDRGSAEWPLRRYGAGCLLADTRA